MKGFIYVDSEKRSKETMSKKWADMRVDYVSTLQKK
jgi:hypothetical protein